MEAAWAAALVLAICLGGQKRRLQDHMMVLTVAWAGEELAVHASVLVGSSVRRDLEGGREEVRWAQEGCLPDWISSLV